tara:strand:- start:6782 stop:6934 length:153 start_codon:yes stop_codon:yes gene_type:complete
MPQCRKIVEAADKLFNPDFNIQALPPELFLPMTVGTSQEQSRSQEPRIFP